MAKKTSATAKNIAAINRNIQTIADIFGIYSSQYNKAIADLFQFDVRENKNGVIQIRNTKANRAKHQKIRARRAKNIKPHVIQRMKRQSEQALKKYNKRAKDNIDSIAEFEQRQQELDTMIDSVYDDARIVEDMLGIEVDRHRMFVDYNYRMKVRAMSENASKYNPNDTIPDSVIEENRKIFSKGIIYETGDSTLIMDPDTGDVLFEY